MTVYQWTTDDNEVAVDAITVGIGAPPRGCTPVERPRRISRSRLESVETLTRVAERLLAPPAETFSKGRDIAAWLGLAPRQFTTGGKQKLGSITKMGERTLRRLLIIGSSAVVLQASKRDEVRQQAHGLSR